MKNFVANFILFGHEYFYYCGGDTRGGDWKK